MSFIKRLAFGFSSFFAGFAMLRKHPSLLKYLLIPMVVAILSLGFGLYFSFSILPEWISQYLPERTSYLKEGLYWLSVILASISSFLLIILNSFVLANIVNIPVNTKLCELLLKKEFQWQAPEKSWLEWLRSFLYFFSIGLIKTAILIFIGILVFVVSFMPFMSLIGATLGMMVLAFDCSDITFEIKEWSLKKRWHFFTLHRIEFLGFALGIGLFSLIPGLNFILLPFIVLGASYMVHTLETRIPNDSVSIS